KSWQIDGTTGYDFMNAVNGLFVSQANAAMFQTIYSHFTSSEVNFRSLTNSTKKMIMLVSLASEINELSQQLERIAERNRRYRDFTLGSLTFAIREVLACLPIYRTYITGPDGVAARDQLAVETAVAEAKKRNPRTAESIFDFIRDTLLFRNLHRFAAEDLPQLTDVVMKFQQLSGPVMAKGVEDTAFYLYNRLSSLNEVGGHPEHFGSSVADFHHQNIARCERWPHAMLATSTHDTKRSEDVRARIDVLSELPDAWLGLITRWGKRNAEHKQLVGGEMAPDSNDEYLLYQTVLGAWPLQMTNERTGQWSLAAPRGSDELFAQFRERIAAYMQKAAKEAKTHTSWVNPNQEYDAALRGFVFDTLDGLEHEDFFEEHLLPLLRVVVRCGQYNSLAQTLLKLTSPGVPDLYQGSELWDLSLVDPDNRRPVDYARRRALLAELKQQIETAGSDRRALVRELLEVSDDGRIKLYVVERVLQFRRAHPELFAAGNYLPLEARGARGDHVCAFARTLDDLTIIVAAPRLTAGLTQAGQQPPIGQQAWQDTWLELPSEQLGWRYENLFTGETASVEQRDGGAALAMAALCRSFPVAVLAKRQDAGHGERALGKRSGE
ncbi:MAG TPA: malto-oligosyltrehalose synthase, partial [Roseiflexaceae bacterium]|nr:malto-oligosyltrehalose synthase [Roseiflexaceae bacterium]